MPSSSLKRRRQRAADPYYRRAVQALRAGEVPFLIGGAYALRLWTGIVRDTKDLDLLLCQRDLDKARAVLATAGFALELTYPHWLAKAYAGEHFIDLIFNMAHGAGPIDATWFTYGVRGELLGEPVLVLAAEEMIASKLMVLDRDRYDGADVAHVLRATAERLDWRRILDRAAKHWQVLLSHLVMFHYIYPGERGRIPAWVMQDLIGRLHEELQQPAELAHVCRGTMLSPTQYRSDIEHWGYEDARLPPWGSMSQVDVRRWTEGVLAGE